MKTSLPRAEVVVIGSELLRGETVDTNSSFITRRLSLLGFDVVRITTIGDDERSLSDELGLVAKKGGVKVITGGLGPTFDDITRKVASRVLKRPLILNHKILEELRKTHLKTGVENSAALEKQALFPLKSEPIPNRRGSAWGFYIKEKEQSLFFLPGVPSELEDMFENAVIPILKREYEIVESYTYTFKVFGLVEADVEERIKDILHEKDGKSVGWGLRVNFPEVWIDLSIKGSEEIQRDIYKKYLKQLKDRLHPYLFSETGESIEEVIGRFLKKRRLSIFLAESCTGGLVSHIITAQPGSSAYFKGGVVAYHNEIKEGFLDVSEDTLRVHGAVSEETAIEMANGARRFGNADIGLSVTGIAGPEGGTKDKPVGTVYISLVDGRKRMVKRLSLSGDRTKIKLLAARWALEILRRYLEGIGIE